MRQAEPLHLKKCGGSCFEIFLAISVVFYRADTCLGRVFELAVKTKWPGEKKGNIRPKICLVLGGLRSQKWPTNKKGNIRPKNMSSSG